MGTTAAPRIEPSNSKLIAPWLHTGLLVALFLGLAVGEAFFSDTLDRSQGCCSSTHGSCRSTSRSWQWSGGSSFGVWRGGLRKTGTKLRELIGGKWASAKDVLVDCGLAIGLWAAWTLAELAWNRGLGGPCCFNPDFLTTTRIGNFAVDWRFYQRRIAKSWSRGYFQKQFEAFTHSRWIALFLQAVLFGTRTVTRESKRA